MKIKAWLILLLVFMPAVGAALEIVVMEPSQDNTLYETDADNGNNVFERSNGQGIYLFTGRTGVDAGYKQRRALIQFDIAGEIPANVRITYAALSLYLSNTPLMGPQFPVSIKLHRMLAPWGEGSSDADNAEGQGTAPELNDATWHHSFYGPDNPILWQDDSNVLQPGGYFDKAPLAAITFGFDFEFYTSACTPELVNTIQNWLDNPAENYGWILLFSEDPPDFSARRFNSREFPQADQRPQLEIHYVAADNIMDSGFETLPVCP